MDADSSPPFELPVCTLLPAAPVEDFDRLATLTRRVVEVPTAAVTLIDREQQVLPGGAGLNPALETGRRTPLSHSFCRHVVAWGEPLIVPDAREHPMTAGNPTITENGVVAYAGMPLTDLSGTVVGTLCVFDAAPRAWTDEELETLRELADACSAQLQLIESKSRTAVLADRDRIASALRERSIRELLQLSMELGSARSQAGSEPVARQLDQAIDSLDTALAGIRGAVYDRAPAPKD